MSLQEAKIKIKHLFAHWRGAELIFWSVSTFLLMTLVFGLGRLSVINNRDPIQIIGASAATGTMPGANLAKISDTSPAVNNKEAVKQNEVVASRNGTKYHYPWCPGAKQIKSDNLIKFTSATAAESAGYTRAANCKF